MRFSLDSAPLGLSRGAVLNIRDADGGSLRVVEGRVWVTQEGCLDDVFLDAGSTHTFEGPGSAVVTPEGDANATAVVVFDGPLTVASRSIPASAWLERLRRPWRTALAAA